MYVRCCRRCAGLQEIHELLTISHRWSATDVVGRLLNLQEWINLLVPSVMNPLLWRLWVFLLSLGGVWLKDDTGERVVNDGAELPKACRGATPVSLCKAETCLG